MESSGYQSIFDKVDVDLHETVQFLSNQGVKVTICSEQPNKWNEKVIFSEKGKGKIIFSESNSSEENARLLEREQKAIYTEIQMLKREIKEKRRRIKDLEKQMNVCAEASIANASSADMQQMNDEGEKTSSMDDEREKEMSSEATNIGNENSVSKRSVAQRVRRERERSEGVLRPPRRPSKFFPSLTPSRRVLAQRRRFEMAREAAKRKHQSNVESGTENEAPNS